MVVETLLHLKSQYIASEGRTRILWSPSHTVAEYLEAAGYTLEAIQLDQGSYNWIDRRQEEHEWIFLNDEYMDPIADSVIQGLPPEDVFLLCEVGERELVERAWITEGLMREILNHRQYNFAYPFPRDYDYIIAIKTLKALQVFPEQRIRDLHPDTLRNALRIRGYRITDTRSQAMTTSERHRFALADEEDYIRGNIFRNPLYTEICHGLLLHHGFTSSDAGHVWLTSKGIGSQHIALEALALQEKEAILFLLANHTLKLTSGLAGLKIYLEST